MKKLLLAGSVLSAALLAATPVLEVKTLNDWSIPKSLRPNVTLENGVFKITPRKWRLNMVTKQLPVDLKKKYVVSFKVRTIPGTKPGVIRLGIIGYDANNKVLTSEMVNFSRGSLTKLVAPASKGDTSVVLENCADWKVHGSYKGDWTRGYQCLAFNAKPQRVDLPNRDFSPRIKKLTKQGDNYQVVFRKPLKKAYPAGTVVRNHRSSATYLYVFSGKIPADWKNVQRSYQGDAGILGVKRNKFWAGTQAIRLIFIALPQVGCEISDLKIEEL